MASSDWVYDHWSKEYKVMLRGIPPAATVRGILERLAVSSGQGRQDLVKFSMTNLAGLHSKAHPSEEVQSPTSPPIVISDDPVWFEDMVHDHCKLRSALKGLRDIDLMLAVTCVKMSKEEKHSFVSELVTRIRDTDQACVSVAAYLAIRAKKNTRVDECWKDLLMHMMRIRPPGLLKRCGENLVLPSWENWVRNLDGICGGRHLRVEGGLGFTREEFEAWTGRKRGRLRRSTSTATASTARTY